MRTPLNSLTLFAPTVQGSILQTLNHDWHQDFVVMVEDRLPKSAVVLLFLFLLWRVVLFFVHRMQRLASRQVGNSQRAAQLRTMGTILRATSLSLLGFL